MAFLPASVRSYSTLSVHEVVDLALGRTQALLFDYAVVNDAGPDGLLRAERVSCPIEPTDRGAVAGDLDKLRVLGGEFDHGACFLFV